MVSLVIMAVRACGSSAATSSDKRSTPGPQAASMPSALQDGQDAGNGTWKPQ